MDDRDLEIIDDICIVLCITQPDNHLHSLIDKVYIDGPCELLMRRSIDRVYIDGPCELLMRRSIDKLYIDGPCELLMRGSIDKLLAKSCL